jgi:hypothetical protein
MTDPNRPFRDVPRAELSQRLRDIDDERSAWIRFIDSNQAELDRLEESLTVKQKTLFGYKSVKLEADLAHLAKTMPLVQQQSEGHRHRSALAQEIQAIQLEFHLRDTPALVEEFGPGVD